MRARAAGGSLAAAGRGCDRNTDAVWDHVEAHRGDPTALADRVWETPETLYAEWQTCAAHAAVRRAEGFRVTEGIAGIPTAVAGEAGDGGPVIAIPGEYDALPGLSQVAGIAEPRPVVPGGNCHGCGHTSLGAGALLAACAVKDRLAAAGLPGRVRYYGCPAEEGGAAKTFMVRDGAFADVAAALTWHPDCLTRVDLPLSLGNTRIDFTFTGRSAHAAASPRLGRSALDAAELMSVGVNYLREHVPQDVRIHSACLDAGGTAPNVVQGRAKVRYSVRALALADMLATLDRVRDVARGAALMTGTARDAAVMSAVSATLENATMDRAMQDALEALGPVPFNDADRAYAAAARATLSPADLAAPWKGAGLPARDIPLHDGIVPLGTRGEIPIGSTDIADVTWALPTTADGGHRRDRNAAHSWQNPAQGKAPAAHKGMVHAAKAVAAVAARLIADPALLAAARAEHARRLAASPCVCPCPPTSPPRCNRVRARKRARSRPSVSARRIDGTGGVGQIGTAAGGDPRPGGENGDPTCPTASFTQSAPLSPRRPSP